MDFDETFNLSKGTADSNNLLRIQSFKSVLWHIIITIIQQHVQIIRT